MLHSRSPTATIAARGCRRRPGPRRGAAARRASRRRQRRRRKTTAASAETRSKAAGDLRRARDAPHALAAAARRRLEEDRIAVRARRTPRARARSWRGSHHAGNDRHARPSPSGAGSRSSSPSPRSPSGAGPTNVRPASRAGAREAGVLGQEAVARDGPGARPVVRRGGEQALGPRGSSRAPARAPGARPRRPARRAARRGRRRRRPRPSRCPSSRHARKIRTAISPRLATSSFMASAVELTAGCSRASSRAARRACASSSRNAVISFSRVSEGSMISSTIAAARRDVRVREVLDVFGDLRRAVSGGASGELPRAGRGC